MSMRGAAAAAAFGWVLCAGAASAGPVTIDGFDTTQSLLVMGGNGPLSDDDGVSAGDAIGGARHATLTRLGGYGTNALTFDGGDLDLLDLSSAAADSVVARLLYDGGTDADISFTGLGGADLTDGHTNTLLRILARSDLVAPLRIRVYSDAANASEATVDLPGLGFATFTALDLLFEDDLDADFTDFFVPVLGGGADFESVGAIVVEILGESRPSLDAQLDSIVATVPEPRTAALLAAGLAGLALLQRRRAG